MMTIKNSIRAVKDKMLQTGSLSSVTADKMWTKG